MATVPTFTDGVPVHKADLDFLLSPPRCQVAIATTATSIPDTTFTLLSWDSSIYDTDSMWSSGSRVAINTSGLWLVHFYMQMATAAYSILTLNLRVNSGGVIGGGTSLVTAQPTGTSATGLAGAGPMTVRSSIEVRLTAGDYLEVFARQSSGATRNLSLATGANGLSARWVSTT